MSEQSNLHANLNELPIKKFLIPHNSCYYFHPLYVKGLINEYKECNHPKNTHKNKRNPNVYQLCRKEYCPLLERQENNANEVISNEGD